MLCKHKTLKASTYIRRHCFVFRTSASTEYVVTTARDHATLARGLTHAAVLKVHLVSGARDFRVAIGYFLALERTFHTCTEKIYGPYSVKHLHRPAFCRSPSPVIWHIVLHLSIVIITTIIIMVVVIIITKQ